MWPWDVSYSRNSCLSIRVESGQGRPADRMSWIQQVLADWPGTSSLSVLFLVLYWYCVRSTILYIRIYRCQGVVPSARERSHRANINGNPRKTLVDGMTCGYCKSTHYSTQYIQHIQESHGTTSPGKKPRPAPGRTVQHSLNVNQSGGYNVIHSTTREDMREMGITS